MEKRRVGKITVSLTLIALGLALLFRERVNFESVYRIYLPAVLIILGVEIIVSKYYYHKKGFETRIEPLIIPLVVLMFFTLVFGVSLELLDKGFEVNVFNEFKYRESRTVSGEMIFEAEDALGLDFKYADLEIVESDTSQIEVYAEVDYRYNDSSKSNLEIDRFLAERRSDGRVDLVYDKGEIEKRNDIGIKKVKYTVRVPSESKSLYLDLMYSDTTISELKLDISTDRFKYGMIGIASITGDLDFKSGYSNVSISEVDGNLSLKSDYSDVELYEIAGDIDFGLSYSELSIENKRVTVGDIRGSGSYSDISVDTIDNQNAVYDLSVSFGDIDADGISLDSVEQMTESTLRGTVGSGERNIVISAKYGDIEIE